MPNNDPLKRDIAEAMVRLMGPPSAQCEWCGAGIVLLAGDRWRDSNGSAYCDPSAGGRHTPAINYDHRDMLATMQDENDASNDQARGLPGWGAR